MKKLLLLLLFSYSIANAQLPTWVYGNQINIGVRDTSVNAGLKLFINGRTTGKYLKNSGWGVSSFGNIETTEVPWFGGFPTYDGRYPSISRLLDSTSALRTAIANNQAVFSTNVVVNGPTGTRVGKYTNGQTIPAAGKTLDQFLQDIATEAVPPTYVAPSVGVNGSPAPGNYEIGTNLGTITLSRSFTQNDGGAATGDTYAKYISSWNNLGSNTDAITSLTQQVYYRVTTSYAQGPCKTNNLGAVDCTGRINAGSVTSGNILYNPFYKRYWGFSNGTAPSNAAILAFSQDNNGTTGPLTLSNITPSGSQFFIYLTRGTVSSVVVNGFPATESFTITTYSVTNAQGFTSTYNLVYSKNPLTGTISSIVIN